MRIQDIMTPWKGQKQVQKGILGDIHVHNLPDPKKTWSDPILEVVDNEGNKIGEINLDLLGYVAATSKMNIISSIIDRIEEGVIVIDAEGKIFYVNQAYSRILGVSIRKIIGKPIQQIEPGAAILDVLRTKEMMVKGRQYIETLDKYVSLRLYPIEQDGELQAVVSIFTDATEIVNLNKEIRRTQEVAVRFQQQVEEQHVLSKFQIVGKSASFSKTVSQALVVAKTDASVLIRGENGTGKEVIAKLVHANSGRKDQPMITVNCAAIPENLIESELFGYEEGAFTGAKHGGKMGKFQLANGGTLFLDEIGDMPMAMQSKLLRVLQEGEIEKIGRHKNIPVDVRLIAATNQPLETMIKEKKFRQDLYYRLNIVALQVPSLRERIDDVGLLANYFLDSYNEKYGKSVGFSQDVLSFFYSYSWPGNVREMQNCIEYAVIMCLGDVFDLTHLPPHLIENNDQPMEVKANSVYKQQTLREAVQALEKKVIQEAIVVSRNNKSKAMKILGLSRRTFYRKLKEYGLDSGEK